MIGGQVTDIEGERQPPTRGTARQHPSRQDRRTAARQRAHGRNLRGGDAAQNRGALALTANMWASRFRLWTTFSMWRNRPKRWARRRAKTPRRARSRSRRFTASRIRARMAPKSSAVWPMPRSQPFGDRARAAARDRRSDRAAEIVDATCRNSASIAGWSSTVAVDIARKGPGADHGGRSSGQRTEGRQAGPACVRRKRMSKCWRSCAT